MLSLPQWVKQFMNTQAHFNGCLVCKHGLWYSDFYYHFLTSQINQLVKIFTNFLPHYRHKVPLGSLPPNLSFPPLSGFLKYWWWRWQGYRQGLPLPEYPYTPDTELLIWRSLVHITLKTYEILLSPLFNTLWICSYFTWQLHSSSYYAEVFCSLLTHSNPTNSHNLYKEGGTAIPILQRKKSRHKMLINLPKVT